MTMGATLISLFAFAAALQQAAAFVSVDVPCTKNSVSQYDAQTGWRRKSCSQDFGEGTFKPRCGITCMAATAVDCADQGDPRPSTTITVNLTPEPDCEGVPGAPGVPGFPALCTLEELPRYVAAEHFDAAITKLAFTVTGSTSSAGGEDSNVYPIIPPSDLAPGIVKFQLVWGASSLQLLIDPNSLYILGAAAPSDDGLKVTLLQDDALGTPFQLLKGDPSLAEEMLGEEVASVISAKMPASYTGLDISQDQRSTMTFQISQMTDSLEIIRKYVDQKKTSGPSRSEKVAMARLIVAIAESTRFNPIRKAVLASMQEVEDSTLWSMGDDMAIMTNNWYKASNKLRLVKFNAACGDEFTFDDLISYTTDELKAMMRVSAPDPLTDGPQGR